MLSWAVDLDLDEHLYTKKTSSEMVVSLPNRLLALFTLLTLFTSLALFTPLTRLLLLKNADTQWLMCLHKLLYKRFKNVRAGWDGWTHHTP